MVGLAEEVFGGVAEQPLTVEDDEVLVGVRDFAQIVQSVAGALRAPPAVSVPHLNCSAN